MKIIAFDSGLERTGYAVMTKDGSNGVLEDYGCIMTHKSLPLQKRLKSIRDEVEVLINTFDPDAFVIEKLFFNNNKTTGIMVAQSQGVVIELAGRFNLNVEFLTPLTVKHVLTGYGNADKKNVQKMVMMLLNLKEVPKPDDTADAIAVGLAFCSQRNLENMIV